MSFSEWEYQKLGKLCSFDKESIDPKDNVQYCHYSFPAFDNNKEPEVEMGENIKSSKFNFKKGDILFNKLNVKFKRVWNIDFDIKDNSICSTEFIPIQSKDIDRDFLYYCLINPNFTNEMKYLSTGTSNSHQRINIKDIQDYDLFLPKSKDIQSKIGYILKLLDKKIKINEKINKNLENILMSIFNSWFINYKRHDKSNGMETDEEYGEVPKGWSVEMIENYVDFVTGVEPGSKNYHEKQENNDIPFLRVGDLSSSNNMVFINKSLSKNKILNYDDIVLSLDGTVGIVKIGLEGAYSTGMRKLVIKNDKINKPFLYCLVKSTRIQKIIETFATGTTILHAGKSIKHMNFVLPDKQTMNEFGQNGTPIISNILLNLKEIERLTNLRDILLPKLMSGEIDVSKVNCDLIIHNYYLSARFSTIFLHLSVNLFLIDCNV
ncbi:restriction endonuclease subunit S [Methanobrevibacter sp.]|uniref:restriction endonuclease subunit S n=1 Tax=Methanobrevibacter sp. TaxID=66852 RepID=UPI003D7C49F0